MIEEYLTVFEETQPIEIKEKNSRFISICRHVDDKQEAEDFIRQLRKIHYDCTHVCVADLLGEGRVETFRYSDDGEPQAKRREDDEQQPFPTHGPTSRRPGAERARTVGSYIASAETDGYTYEPGVTARTT